MKIINKVYKEAKKSGKLTATYIDTSLSSPHWGVWSNAFKRHVLNLNKLSSIWNASNVKFWLPIKQTISEVVDIVVVFVVISFPMPNGMWMTIAKVVQFSMFETYKLYMIHVLLRRRTFVVYRVMIVYWWYYTWNIIGTVFQILKIYKRKVIGKTFLRMRCK